MNSNLSAIEKINESVSKNSTSLDLVSLNLKELPNELRRATHIQKLNLSFNQLEYIPDWIDEFINLEAIDLRNNNLKELPYSIGNLRNLKSLHLGSNNLQELPDSLSKSSNLVWLSLLNNQLKILDKWVFENKSISIDNNPIIDPPLEIYKRGVSAVLNYFQEQERGIERLYEAKLLIVGEGGAGKTTLTKKIINENYKLSNNQSSTQGIDIVPFYFKTEELNSFRINIWDFGGQEIYHTTHQFFLTKRSLYILVSDNRAEDTDFNYWLQNVELLSAGSPLIIIQNERQDRKKDINERGMRDRFRNLSKIISTNISTNKNGVKNIIKEIKHQIQLLPHIGTELPKVWLDVRKQLENIAKGTPYIDEKKYFEVCRNNGMDEQERALFLSEYLHDLGIFLHFRDNSVLKRWIILRPDWGTQAVYKILDNKNVINRSGYFNKKDLKLIWYDKSYADMHDELIELMKKFELCYEIDNKNEYIAAQLLPREKPIYKWENENNLLVKYEYEFMPNGILTRFIVRIHHLIESQKLVWREGVILSREGAQAEVIETYGKKDIVIKVRGQNKKELLAIIFDSIDQIHSSYERIKVEKMIPCNCAQCKKSMEPHLFEYTLTKRMLDKDIDSQICHKSFELVKNRLLIDDVFGAENLKEVSTRIFLSYAPEDESWIEQLRKHALPLEKGKNIFFTTNKDSIYKQGSRASNLDLIEASDVFVAALSSDYYANKDCMEYELRIALTKAEHSEILLVPLILRDSIHEEVPTEVHKPILFNNKPLSEAKDRDQAYVNMLQQLVHSIESYRKGKSVSGQIIP